MTNARASFIRRVKELADAGIPVLTEPSKPWVDPCYRVEFLYAEVPRGAGFFASNVRVHVRGSDGGTFEQEGRLRRLLNGLGLQQPYAVAVADLYEYTADPDAPQRLGTFKIERSPRGVTSIPAPAASPTIRHLVANLVVVYQQKE